MVQNSGAELTVFDLLDAIRAKIPKHPKLHLRMARQVHETLGKAWQSAKEMRFDLEAAVESLRYFDGAQIPKVPAHFPRASRKLALWPTSQMLPRCLAKRSRTRADSYAAFERKKSSARDAHEP